MSENTTEMQIDPARARALASQIGAVTERIAAAGAGRSVSGTSIPKAFILI